MDILVDRNTGDVVFQNGACPVVSADSADVVAQRLFILLRTWRAEWFLDTTYGVPYESILGMKVSKTRVDRILQSKILEEQGVAEMVSWSSEIEPSTRVYTCRFQVRTTFGAVTDTITVSPQT